MKVGDLVIMPNAKDRILRSPFSAEPLVPGVGLVIDDGSVKNRTGVMWAGASCVDFEPTEWLQVINTCSLAAVK
jgi:hypothetical protein